MTVLNLRAEYRAQMQHYVRLQVVSAGTVSESLIEIFLRTGRRRSRWPAIIPNRLCEFVPPATGGICTLFCLPIHTFGEANIDANTIINYYVFTHFPNTTGIITGYRPNSDVENTDTVRSLAY